jgi:DNA-directed RNA polymerase sigma subunit (sigma70/sigma32)
VSSFDPLRHYLDEVRAVPTLTSTEEQRLLALVAEGHASASRALCVSLLAFVADIAMEARPEWMAPLDAIERANRTMADVVDSFPAGNLHRAVRRAVEERLGNAISE